ncbi:MAG: hypothetical protein K6D02_00595 [Lachnospiraceae bacterium]|nr:hypothetical protein [Lachnospiraceae bacterium]
MSKTLLTVDVIYAVIALIMTVIGIYKHFMKKSPLFVRMVVCVVGCRFFDGTLEVLLVRGGIDVDLFTISGLVQVAQFLFLICASIGALDSLCDDGSKTFRKYRVISTVIPAMVFIGMIIILGMLHFPKGEMIMRLMGAAFALFAMYFHIKHLIIPDVEGGIVRSIRLYNVIGIINCLAFLVCYTAHTNSIPWIVARVVYILVTITILPALMYGVKKWTE